jgi:hypothetical protein
LASITAVCQFIASFWQMAREIDSSDISVSLQRWTLVDGVRNEAVRISMSLQRCVSHLNPAYAG